MQVKWYSGSKTPKHSTLFMNYAKWEDNIYTLLIRMRVCVRLLLQEELVFYANYMSNGPDKHLSTTLHIMYVSSNVLLRA